MQVITLTQQERERFAAYLVQSAESDDLMAKNAESLGPHGAQVVKMLRTRAAAALMIAKDLRSIEDMTVSS